MKKIIEELTNVFQKLGIKRMENVELLLDLTKEDIEKQTDLNDRVTLILEKLLRLSHIYVWLDDDEENELLAMNQTDFFSKIHYVVRLSEQLLDEFRKAGIIHPILATDFELEDIISSQEDCISILAEISNILSTENQENDDFEDESDIDSFNSLEKSIFSQISTYFDRVTGYYQVVFFRQVIPVLRDAMFVDDYQNALEKLSDYIDLKLKLLGGLDDDNSLYLCDIAVRLQGLLDAEIVGDIYSRMEIEGEQFDPEELEDDEYLNLLILMFQNRYHKHKACRYYYHTQLLETEICKEKCKKL